MKHMQPYQKISIVISVLLHVLLFGLLFFHFSHSKMAATKQVKIVQATAIQESQLHPASSLTLPSKNTESQNTIRKIEQMTLKQPEAPMTPISKSLDKPVSAPVSTDETLALLAPNLEAKQARQKLEERKRMAELKRKETELAKERREEEARQLQKELAKSQEKAQTNEQGQDSEASDQETEKSTEPQSLAAQSGDIDKYKQMIIQAISHKWLIPDTTDPDLACQLLVHLGPGGIVLNIDILKNSGDENLDRSARNAIMKASPLPVPENTELFDNFRSLRLTFRPQGIVSG